MTDREAIVRMRPEGRTLAFLGGIYRFLATSEDTAGRYAQWENLVPPGSAPPPHVHGREDEGFFVTEGELVFEVGGKRTLAPAGTFANLPAGVPHRFMNESDAVARVVITVAPGGLERMFFELGVEVEPGCTTPPEHEFAASRVAEVASRYGVQILKTADRGAGES